MKSLDNARVWLYAYLIVSHAYGGISPSPESINVVNASMHEYTTQMPGHLRSSTQQAQVSKRDGLNESFLGINLLDCHASCYSCTGRCLVNRSKIDDRNATQINHQSWKDDYYIVEDMSLISNCNWACWCDVRCTIYGDCCYDFYRLCLKLNNNETIDLFESGFQEYDGRSVHGSPYGSSNLCARIPELIRPFQSALAVRACLSSVRIQIDEFSSNMYYLVSRCPSTWGDDDVRSACENNSMIYAQNIPVNDPTGTGIVFKNVYCAHCHARNISQSDFWSANVSCPIDFLRNLSKAVTNGTGNNFSVNPAMCELYLMPRNVDFLRSSSTSYLTIHPEQKIPHQLDSTSEISFEPSKWACYVYRLPVMSDILPVMSDILETKRLYANPHCAMYHDVHNFTCGKLGSIMHPVSGVAVEKGRYGVGISLPLLFSFRDSNLYDVYASYEQINADLISSSNDGNTRCAIGEVYSVSSKSCRPNYEDGQWERNQTRRILIQADAVLFNEISQDSSCSILLSETDRLRLVSSTLCQEHEESQGQNRGSSATSEFRGNGFARSSGHQSPPSGIQYSSLSDLCSKTITSFYETISINSNNRSSVAMYQFIIDIVSNWKAENTRMLSKLDNEQYVTYRVETPTDMRLSGDLLNINDSSDANGNNTCIFSVAIRLYMTFPTEGNTKISEFISTLVNRSVTSQRAKTIRLMNRESLINIGNISVEGGMKCNESDSDLQFKQESISFNNMTVSYVQSVLEAGSFAFTIPTLQTNTLKVNSCYQVDLSLWERTFGKCQAGLLTIEHYRFEETYAYFNYKEDSYRTGRFVLINKTLAFCSSNFEKMIKAYVMRDSTLDSYVTIIGLSLSIICLILTFLTYCLFPSLRNVPGLLVMSLTITFAMAMLLFLVGVNQTDMLWVCTAIASVLHFLWFSVFLWMNALSFDICRSFSANLKPSFQTKSRIILRYAAFAIGVPLVTVMSALATGFISSETKAHSVYGNEFFCWISNPQLNLYWFGILIAISQVVNVCFFVRSVYSIFVVKRLTANVTNDHGKIFDVLLYFKLSLIMGIAWLLFFLSSSDPSNVLFSISTILNSLNGVFIFIVFVCKRWVLRLFSRRFGAYKARKSQISSTTRISSSIIPYI